MWTYYLITDTTKILFYDPPQNNSSNGDNKNESLNKLKIKTELRDESC